MVVKRDPLKILICGAGIGGLSAAITFRLQGHDVEMFEQSRFACEIGAAIHLPPNAYGMLKHLDVPIKQLGGNLCEYITELDPQGEVLMQVSTSKLLKEYPYPWHLVHRADLHSALKTKATSEDGIGKPVKINLSSKVEKVDSEEGLVILESGKVFKGDLVVGADGIHSLIRDIVTGTSNPATASGFSAFRFLIPRETAKAIKGFENFLKHDGNVQIWLGEDRRIVIYPCRNNTTLNFVCIHPDSANSGSAEGWANLGTKEDLLSCYKDFFPPLVELLGHATDIKLWKLLERPTITSWTKGRVALLGDAAHSFLPHQGQGGAQAIEDGVALGTVFPLGIPPEDIKEHLKIYEEARVSRATTIQQFTRVQALMPKDGKQLNSTQFSHFNWSHDAYFHSRKLLARFLENKVFKRMPIGWGPLQGPRQDYLGKPIDGSGSFLRTGAIRIKTTKSYLEHLLPNDKFSIDVPGEIAYITFSNTWTDNIEWLSGHDYSHFDFYLENVVYTSDSGKKTCGRFLPLLLEGRTEPTLSGREELGMPKIFTSLTESFDMENGYTLSASWEGSTFLEMKIKLPKKVLDPPKKPNLQGTMEWRCIPRPGGKGKTDAEYATYTPEPVGGAEFILKEEYEGIPDLSFLVENITPEKLPCHYNVARRLSEIPILELQRGKVLIGSGLPDLSNQCVLGL
ncbi:uncharacterized protein PRCAT00005096001 [Priceomyces carsonii]|uniref:uncharacterized protein n=1 Tax=Priceomyces carsonii TaxID=28549 RepID=UPI002EDA1FEB|nr:unnamed protein product [Priceomyces carsonii]